MKKSIFSMKRPIFLLAVACVIGGGPALAQEKIRFGVKAGLNVASFGITNNQEVNRSPKDRPVFSFHVGGLVDVPLAPAFSLQGGLSLSGKGHLQVWTEEDEQTGYYGETRFKENLLYLELPVNAVYKTGSFFFGAGPYVGYALSGKWKESHEDDFGDGVELEEDSGDVIFSGENAYRQRLDYGVNFLAGYQINNNLNLSLGYGLGLKNNYDGPEWNVKNRVFSVSVGYTF